MSQSRQISRIANVVPIRAIVVLATVFAFGFFMVGFDQGHIFSLVYGQDAYATQFIHELTHDMRHAAGFPCH